MKKEKAEKIIQQFLKKINGRLRHLEKATVLFYPLQDNNPGKVDIIRDYIYIDPSQCSNRDKLLNIFLHEYLHLYCKYEKIFAAYHCIPADGFTDLSQFKKFIRTWLKAEIYVEKLAAFFLVYFYPKSRPTFDYNTPETKQYFKNLVRCRNYEEDYPFFKEYYDNLKNDPNTIFS